MLIDPKDLAKRTKESARTVSLRIKEKTWVGFEQLAKENQTTANALIGELADYYIESLNGSHSLDLSDSTIAFNKFKTFLEKEVRKMCRWTIDNVVSDLSYNDANDYYESLHSYSGYINLVKREHENIDIDETFMSASPFVEEVWNEKSDESFWLYPTLRGESVFNASPNDPVSGLGNMVYIPVDKAPDIVRLFKVIHRYCLKNAFFVDYDGDLMDKITVVINKYKYGLVEKTNEKSEYSHIEYDEGARRAMLEEISHLILNTVANSLE